MRLRDGLSWCLCNGRPVFLDAERDRYFCLSAEAEAAFHQWCDEGAACCRAALSRLCATNLLVAGDAGPDDARLAIAPAARDFAAEESVPARLRDVAEAVVAQIWTIAKLRRTALSTLLAERGRPTLAVSVHAPEFEGPARRVAAAFTAAGMVMRVADRCLPRALAAHAMCGRRGIPAQLVFGVRIAPFHAHCWVQSGDGVIVGDLEQVRLFTPIRVVQ